MKKWRSSKRNVYTHSPNISDCDPNNRCPPGPPGPKGVPGERGPDGDLGKDGPNGEDAEDVPTIQQKSKHCFNCPAGRMGPTV